ncbi:hypothetical protein DXG03_007934 [Asterophora parasitica]|uniref:Uncharacterized protein n=1 Tax=Asterophora parasitica TaxID=117018 RepID=A0A9P7KAK7_9AGAR|nr:hypothetical protein DXG03_007934 [Asterophora parasitica]
MTTTIVEQRLPLIIQFISSIPALWQYATSVTAIVVFWLQPSLAPQMPVRVILPSNLRRIESTHSLKSTASTLIDINDGACDTASTRDTVVDDCEESRKFTNPFSKLPTPKMAMSPSLTLRPFARRMTMPARRLSEHITATLARHTPSSPFTRVEEDSYFTPHNHTRHLPVVEMKRVEEVEEEVDLVEVRVAQVQRVDPVARVEGWVEHQKDIVVEVPIVPTMAPVVSHRKKKTGLRNRAHRRVERTLQRVRHSF